MIRTLMYVSPVVLTLVGCLPAGLLFDIQPEYNLGLGFGLSVVAALLCILKDGLLAVRDKENFLYKYVDKCLFITVYYFRPKLSFF